MKGAALRGGVSLQPHQERVARRVADGEKRLLIYHGLGSGKCVRGDTPILLDTGLTNFAALFGDRAEGPEAELVLPGRGRVLAYVGGAPAWLPIRALYRKKLADGEATTRIETLRGNHIEGTGVHRLLRARDGQLDWPTLAEVRPGDHLAMTAGIPEPPEPATVDEDLAVLLAWQVTEGHERPHKASVQISQDNPALLDELRARFRRLVPTSDSGHIRGGGDKTAFLKIDSVAYRDLLVRRGYAWGKLAGEKELPRWFVALSSPLLRQMLRCIFDAEGHAGTNNVELTLKSPKLLAQIQYALLRFGVRSSWHGKWSAATNGSRIRRRYYRISISGEDAATFRDEIGFGYAYKQEALVRLTACVSNPNYGVPIGDALEVLRSLGILKAVGMSSTAKRTCSVATCGTLAARLRWLLSAEAITYYEGRIRRYGGTAGRYSRRTLASITTQRAEVEACLLQVEAMASLSLRFEPVETVESGRIGGFVYDIEVDSDAFADKNYAAGIGAFVSHNSLASIAAADRAGGDYTAVVPASLRPNFGKEVDRFTEGGNRPEVLSYSRVALGARPSRPPSTLVLDEAHRLRNQNGAASRAVAELARNADRVLMLSGTPIVNRPNDLAAPLSILGGEPMTTDQFDQRFIGHETVRPGFWGKLKGVRPVAVPTIKDEEGLADLLRGKVDYHPSRAPEGVDVDRERVPVELGKGQRVLSRLLMGQLPRATRWKIRNNYPMTSGELSRLQSFMVGPRQVGLSDRAFDEEGDALDAFRGSTKLQAAFGRLRSTLDDDPRAKAIAYSNFVGSGIEPYAAGLADAGIPHSTLHGKLNDDERRKQLEDYNEGRSRVLLMGPAGAEGISTKGTQLVQLLDPHWNEARSSQAEGRGLRFDSHEGLPEELRRAKIERYIATNPPPVALARFLGQKPRPTADEFLEAQTRRKELLNEQFRNVLRRVGSEPKSAAADVTYTDYPEKGTGRTRFDAHTPRRLLGLRPGKNVGFAVAHLGPNESALEALRVHSGHRRQGIGRELLRRVVDASGDSNLSLKTDPYGDGEKPDAAVLRDFYASEGFAPVPDSEHRMARSSTKEAADRRKKRPGWGLPGLAAAGLGGATIAGGGLVASRAMSGFADRLDYHPDATQGLNDAARTIANAPDAGAAVAAYAGKIPDAFNRPAYGNQTAYDIMRGMRTEGSPWRNNMPAKIRNSDFFTNTFAARASTRAHYTGFKRGPLSAHKTLTRELLSGPPTETLNLLAQIEARRPAALEAAARSTLSTGGGEPEFLADYGRRQGELAVPELPPSGLIADASRFVDLARHGTGGKDLRSFFPNQTARQAQNRASIDAVARGVESRLPAGQGALDYFRKAGPIFHAGTDSGDDSAMSTLATAEYGPGLADKPRLGTALGIGPTTSMRELADGKVRSEVAAAKASLNRDLTTTEQAAIVSRAFSTPEGHLAALEIARTLPPVQASWFYDSMNRAMSLPGQAAHAMGRAAPYVAGAGLVGGGALAAYGWHRHQQRRRDEEARRMIDPQAP